MEVAVDRGEQRCADHIKAGDRNRRVDDRQRRARGVDDQRNVRRGADHQPGVDAGGEQADEDLARFGGNRGDLVERRKLRDLVRQLGAGQIRAGEMLGQEPFHLREILAPQIRVAQLLRPPRRTLGSFDGLRRVESGRSFFKPLGRSSLGLLVHVRRPRSVGENLSAIRNRRECQRARLSLPAPGAGSATGSSGAARAGAHSAPMISSRVLLVLDTTSLGEPVEGTEPYSAGSGGEAGGEAAAALPCAASSSS